MESLYNLSPLLHMMGIGALLALAPLAWVWLRNRRSTALGREHALALLTLFLTFDLVLFGAFTRLTDSGLGCPDWPGCYGNASPLGAAAHIDAAQSAMPTGPVTHEKAWIEMIHRYLATGVGALILFLTVSAWLRAKRLGSAAAHSQAVSPWLPTLSLLWVCIQGAFGALTVTMKLFPAIVTLHLLGGLVLLALLTAQVVRAAPPDERVPPALTLQPGLHWLAWLAFLTLIVQATLGAWVSTNYAVLACTDFPMCQASWWPQMDFSQGFEIWRELGLTSGGEFISFAALTAIHFGHRLAALVVLPVLGVLAWQLNRIPALRPQSRWLAMLTVLQALTGISNVVLEWPLASAIVHTGGAGALVMVLTWVVVSSSMPSSAPERKLTDLMEPGRHR